MGKTAMYHLRCEAHKKSYDGKYKRKSFRGKSTYMTSGVEKKGPKLAVRAIVRGILCCARGQKPCEDIRIDNPERGVVP